MTEQSWVEKHRPETWNSIQGNNSDVEDIREWVEGFTPGDSPILLSGPAGVGKTSTAYVAATESDRTLNEIDTSTARKTADIERIALEARNADQLLLLDEVDSWPPRANLTPLAEVLADPPCPVIMTANDDYDVPYALKGPADAYEFSLSKSSRRAKLKKIAKAEGIPLSDDDLERLADRPDLRTAINDLQIHHQTGLPVSRDTREWDGSDFAAMDSIIQQEDAGDVDMKPPWLLMWLDQNIRTQLRGFEAAVAYDALARADVRLGESGEGDYRGWRYASALLEQVASLRLAEPYTGWVRWSFPEWVQSSMPDPTDEDPEATLYRELKGYGDVGFNLSGGYAEYRGRMLPILRRLPADDQREMVIREGLSDDAAEALGVESGAAIEKAATAGESLQKSTGNAMESDW